MSGFGTESEAKLRLSSEVSSGYQEGVPRGPSDSDVAMGNHGSVQ